MSINDGGPAFPCQSVTTQHGVLLGDMGMTLRDYFAAAALQGMIAAGENYSTGELCEYAYGVADDMLALRDKK